MSIFGAALITFFSFSLLAWHLSPTAMRRFCGYAMWFDILVHGTVLWLFLGTSTLGLMQAELSAIMFSFSLRGYRWLKGYERLEKFRWIRYSGLLTK